MLARPTGSQASARGSTAYTAALMSKLRVGFSETPVTRPPTLQEVSTAREAGGLSGRPLFSLATRMLAESYVRVEGAFPLIGVGGIDSGEAAIEKIRAGACLIQLYSALVFHGLRIVPAIKSELSNALRRENQPTIDELVGTDAAAMTAEPWPR